ncbi:MAG: TrmH family tRNA/rRNA methyltransferase [uncultured bacterium]|uniref:tRNA/rRNA methyltransferase SpoU type domain-containing protein n=1 Tax=candidate division WWE3 bacterium RBG_16_37_10 TaxID=1802610 RepID=A0A1F4UZI0_UNCKA|nr:MAG: TrmH family tRNA/rRNA methyltransferase [uncultured bacterium]OGC49613.1 MAG: hypothetical protein A2W32_00885 [candidate division WWE3 bacterium RBG_16_37_10]
MKNIYIALENIRSLFNIGAIFRTCSFFGVDKVILVGYSGKTHNTKNEVVLHEEVKKASLGSESDLTLTMLETCDDLINFAKENKLKLIAIEQDSNSIKLGNWIPEDNCILVFGNEVDGVDQAILKKSDQIIEIKRLGKHNSLNVTTACGIILQKVTSK